MKDEDVDFLFDKSSDDLDEFIEWLKSSGDPAVTGLKAERALMCRILAKVTVEFPTLIFAEDALLSLASSCYMMGYRRCEQDRNLKSILK